MHTRARTVEDLTSEIETVAQQPAEGSVDGQAAKNQPLPDLIAADKYLKGQQALTGSNPKGGKRSAWGKVRMARAIPQGGA